VVCWSYCRLTPSAVHRAGIGSCLAVLHAGRAQGPPYLPTPAYDDHLYREALAGLLYFAADVRRAWRCDYEPLDRSATGKTIGSQRPQAIADRVRGDGDKQFRRQFRPTCPLTGQSPSRRC
jgi:hypothetical protein